MWALPTPGGADDFPRLVRLAAALDPSRSESRAVRILFAIRFKLGELLGWDDPDAGLPSLRDRLPPDLRAAPAGPEFDPLPFASIYMLDDEWAAEAVSKPVHGVLHMGWVADGAGGYRCQMAVLVKRNNVVGSAYMAAILPFRHLVVYPPMMREFGRAWDLTAPEGAAELPELGAARC